MRAPLKLRTVGLLVSGVASAGLLQAQAPRAELMVQRAATGFCERATFSRDGKLLLAGSNYGLVWLLDAHGKIPERILLEAKPVNQTKAEYEAPSGAIVSALFSRDGSRADAVESPGSVWLWNTTDW